MSQHSQRTQFGPSRRSIVAGAGPVDPEVNELVAEIRKAAEERKGQRG